MVILVGRSDFDQYFIRSAHVRSRRTLGIHTQQGMKFVFERGNAGLGERFRSCFQSKGLIRLRDWGARLTS
jgi:hypothetical protein